jgi:hypothetical protein
MVAGPPIRAARGHGAMLYPTAVVGSIRGAIPDPYTVDEMPVTMVTMTIVAVIIVAISGSSMVAVMITHRMPIVAAIVSHAWVVFGLAIVLARGDVAARSAVRVTTASSSTACSLSTATTGVVASATTTAFCHECQQTRTRMELVQASTRVRRAIR